MKLLICLLIGISLVGCGNQESAKQAMLETIKSCAGTATVELTLGTWNNQVVIRCSEVKK